MSLDDTQPATGLSLGGLLGMAPDASSRVGEVIDARFRLEAVLGQGGMGVVYRARQLNVERDVAIKLIQPLKTLSASPDDKQRILERFEREMNTTAQLEHPNIIRLYDVGTTVGGDVYMAMELLEGRTLRELIAEEGPLPAARVQRIGVQLASALQAAHGRGIVHRDLKPDNVMIRDMAGHQDVVTVLDFGLAQLASGQNKKLTNDGYLLGTPAYAAPEQARGMAVDHRADLYATGTILYEALTGAPVFDGGSALDLMHQHSYVDATPASERKPVPKWLDVLLLELLAKKPEQRPQSAEELKTRLESGAHGATAGRASGSNGLLVAITVLLIAGGVVAWWLGMGGDAEPKPEAGKPAPTAKKRPSKQPAEKPPGDKVVSVPAVDLSAGKKVDRKPDAQPPSTTVEATFDGGRITSFAFDSVKLTCRFDVQATKATKLVVQLRDATTTPVDSFPPMPLAPSPEPQPMSVTFDGDKAKGGKGNLRCLLYDSRANLIRIPSNIPRPGN